MISWLGQRLIRPVAVPALETPEVVLVCAMTHKLRNPASEFIPSSLKPYPM